MRCPKCRGENPEGGRYCISCGAPLPVDTALQEPARGTDVLSALQEELSGIEFALQELGRAFRREAAPRRRWRAVRRRLRHRQTDLLTDLVRIYASQSPEEALSNLTGLVLSYPDNVRARLERGRILHQLGRLQAAEEDYVLAAVLDAKQAEPHLRLAQFYQRQDQKSRALYEYRTYLSLEPEEERRGAVERLVQQLEDEVLSQQRQRREPVVGETAPRLEYLLATLREVQAHPGPETGAIERITGQYTKRLADISPPPATLVAPAAREESPPVALVAPEAARPALQRSDAPPAARAPAPPARPLRPTAPPRAPRKPFNWAAFWAGLFSERTLTTILGFGVLLVAISSLSLVIEQWREGGRVGKSYDDVWAGIQALLVGELLLLLFAGHIVKERLKLRLSGLGIISLGALWVPFNVGALMYMVYDAPGNVVLPGLGLNLDLPTQAWLIVAASTMPPWALLTYRYRGHLLTHGTVAATGATVALALATAGAPWEWSVASLAVLTVPLLAGWHRLRQTSLKTIADPLFWTAQAVLLGVTGILLGFWAVSEISSYPLAVAGAAGTGLYALAHRYTSRLAYQYLLVGLPAVSFLYALGEAGALRLQFFDALLLGLATAYLLAARRLQGLYQPTLLRQWPALQPTYAVGYLCAAAAIIWPVTHEVSRTVVLYGTATLSLVSARWSGRVIWTAVGGLLLVPAFLLTLDLIEPLPLDYWSVGLGLLAWVYLGWAIAMRRTPDHTVPLFLGALALSVASLVWAISTLHPTVLSLALPVAIVTFGGYAILAHNGRDMALTRMLVYVATYVTSAPVDEQRAKGWGSVVFLALAAALAPAWTTMLRLWAELPELWTGLDFMALAILYTIAASRLMRHKLMLHALMVLTVGMALVLAAPIYHAGAVGLDWALTGILYADVALAALAAVSIRRPGLLYVPAALLALPFALTLELAELSITQWAVPWALLSVAYFLGGLALGRRPAATPLLHLTYPLTLVALGWTAADSSGAMARWTLPMAATLFAASAVLVHRQGPGNLHDLAESAVGSLGRELPPERRRQVAATGFGLAAAVLLPLWVSLLLLWRDIAGPLHAYNPLGWAFVAFLLAHFLRRLGTLYPRSSLAFGGLLAVAAVGVPLGFAQISQEVLTTVLYGVTALSALYRLLLRNPLPLYLAAALLVVAFLLTLDLADLDPLLWSTPIMALAVAHLGLGVWLGRRQPMAASPIYHVGYAVSGMALAWTVVWVLTNWWDAIPDTAPMSERLFMGAGLLLGAVAYAVGALRCMDVRFGHLAAWVLAGALGIVLDGLPLSPGSSSVAVALGATAYVLAGLALRRLGPAQSSDNPERHPVGALPGRVRFVGSAFSWPLLVAGYVIAAISLGMATFTLLDVQVMTWPVNTLYLINVGLLGATAYLSRAPAFAVGAAALFTLPFTLTVYDLFANSPGLLALPSAVLAFAWTCLALGYLAVGVGTERRAPRFARALPALGYLLLVGAVVASLGSAWRQSVVFGAIVAVAIASAVLTHRRLTTSTAEVLSTLLAVPLEAVRRYLTLAFTAVASLLSPLWALEVLALFTGEMPLQGLVLALAAPAYLLVGALVARRSLRFYAWPVYAAAYGMTIAAPVLAWSSLPYSVTTLALGSATFLLGSYLSRSSTWSQLALLVAEVLLSITLVRVLGAFDLSREDYGLGLMAMALVNVVLASLVDRWAWARKGLSSWYGVAFVLSVMGVILAVPESSDAWPVSITAFSLGALFYGLVAFRLRSPVPLYPAIGLAVASYCLGLALLPLDQQYLGLALLPGAVVSLGVGWLLHRRVQRPAPPVFLRRWSRLADASSALEWESPFLAVGYGLAVAGVGFSAPYEVQRLVALLALTGIFTASLGVFRGWGWLYPLLLSAHLAWAAVLTLSQLGLPREAVGLLFIPATVGMMASLRADMRRRQATGPTALLVPRAAPFLLFGALDLGTSVVLAAFADWAGLVMCASYAALFAVAAQTTGLRLLPYASTAFVTGSVIFTSRLFGLGWSQSAVVWATQGLVMWWGGQAAGLLARREQREADTPSRLHLWQAPLRNAGLRLSWFALAFVVAMLSLGLVAPERFASSLQDASAVLAVLGLLYSGMALIGRRVWSGYLAVALVLASWTIQAIDLNIPNAQAYAIPAGLYLLGIAYFERRRLPGGLPVVASGLPGLLDGAAVLLLVASSFWQSVTDEPSWVYALLLAMESILLVLWGAVNRTRFPSLGGIVAFVVNVLYQTTGLLSTMSGAVIGVTIGLLVIAVIAGIEWKREQFIRLARDWTSQAGRWRW